MNLQTETFKHSLKTLLGMLGLALLAAALVSSASITKARAGNMDGRVKAPSPAMAVKTSPSGFNQGANDVRPSKPPSAAKEPCRGRHCPHHWPHTH